MYRKFNIRDRAIGITVIATNTGYHLFNADDVSSFVPTYLYKVLNLLRITPRGKYF